MPDVYFPSPLHMLDSVRDAHTQRTPQRPQSTTSEHLEERPFDEEAQHLNSLDAEAQNNDPNATNASHAEPGAEQHDHPAADAEEPNSATFVSPSSTAYEHEFPQPKTRRSFGIKASLRIIDSYIQIFTRAVSLEAFYESLPGTSSQERPKVAIHRRRSVAVIRSIIHLVPLAALLVLVLLNATRTVDKHYSADSSTPLQFAAKLLEVLAQTSLADIYLSFIRRWLLGSEGIPLGSLFGPLQTTSISYLWSLEFWGSLTSGRQRFLRRLLLAIITFVIIILAALIGPSGAVLMIPRPLTVTQSVGVAVYDSEATLFPQNVTLGNFLESDIKQMSIEASIATTLRQPSQGNSSVYKVADSFGIRTAYVNLVNAAATVPLGRLLLTVATADGLSTQSIEDETMVFSFRQPLVRTICKQQTYFPDGQSASESVAFEDAQSSDLISFGDVVNASIPVPGLEGSSSYSVISTSAPAASPSERHSALLVYAIGQISTADIIANITTANASDFDWMMMGCSIDAVWAQTSYNYTHNAGLAIVQPNTTFESSDLWNASSERMVVDPRLVSHMILTMIDAAFDTSPVVDVDYSALSFSFATAYGLSLVSEFSVFRNPSPFAELPQEQQHTLNTTLASKNFENKEVVFLDTAGTWTSAADLSFMPISTTRDLHGYALQSITVILSLVVVLVYCMTVALFLLYSLATGEASSSWDTISELFMLALNTKPPTHMGKTSAGVLTFATYRRFVNVRARTGEGASEGLELVFLDAGEGDAEEGKKDFEMVEYNKAY